MDSGKVSITALTMAFARAQYTASGPQPRVFEDHFARRLLSADALARIEAFHRAGLPRSIKGTAASARGKARLLAMSETYPRLVADDFPDLESPADIEAMQHWAGMGNAPNMARAVYNEEKLAAAISRGVGQYVILGAGLDTFAWRRPDLMRRLQVVEVDQPTTQAYKVGQIKAANMTLPENLYFLPVNFEQDTLETALSRTSFDLNRPAFFSWLGVTYYLTAAAVEQTIRSLRAVAYEGSEVVLDYRDRNNFVPPRPDDILRREGESFQTAFTPSDLEQTFRHAGFELLEDLGPEEREDRYFKDQPAHGVHVSGEGMHWAHGRAV